MFQNVFMSALTSPLCYTNEINSWENRPFTTIWPEPQQQAYQGKEVVRKITKKKRYRTAYSTEQLQALEHSFAENRYITPQIRRELAIRLNIGEKCIKVWFQNRRMKEKRDSESSFESSDGSSTSASPPLSVHNEDVKVDLQTVNVADSKQIHSIQGCNTPKIEVPQYEPPPYNYYPQYYTDPSTMQPDNHFCNDTNVYPTQYYPLGTDYQVKYPQCDENWSKNIFDMGYY